MELTLTNIINKLVGDIEPLGCHAQDQCRLANLKVMTQLVDDLVRQIKDVAKYHDRQEYSVKALGQEAYECLISIKEDLDYTYDEETL